MPSFNEDPDYLVGTKLNRDPESFREVVREAFLLEYGCSTGESIARVVDVDPTQISHLYKDCGSADSVSIANLIKPLRNPRNKRRILRAWVAKRFGVDMLERSTGAFVRSPPSLATLRRVKQQMGEGQLLLAAVTALKAASKAKDRNLREQLYDHALVARQRSALPGQTMKVAKLIGESAIEHGDSRRFAFAMQARTLAILHLPDSTPDEVEPLLRDFEAALATAAPIAEPAPPYAMPGDQAAKECREVATLLFMERGVTPLDRRALEEMAQRLEAELRGIPKAKRFSRHVFAGRIYTLLENYFLAEEHLEKAYRSDRGRRLHAREICAVLQSRIIRSRDSTEAAREYLTKASLRLRVRWDLAHAQLVETDLARLESVDFRS